MEVSRVVRVLLVVVPLLVSVERSDCVRCFARFNKGQCNEEVGEVDQDDCCQNPHYGYQDANGVCSSCGPPMWSPWSSWSQCNTLCGAGVKQRSRKCFGIGECEDATNKLETVPCNGTCCNNEGWDSWLNWSPCSVTCGGSGVRKRNRVCSAPPHCRATCLGTSEETEECVAGTTCPVHGGWSLWSGWSQCSGPCISDQRGNVLIPSRRRIRSCSNPAPSSDTVPRGNSCPGDDSQDQNCSELPNCPVDGGWGSWLPSTPCSVTCGEGIQLLSRKCDQPTPKYGGHYCEGPSTKISVCQSPCPVDGVWTGWSAWGECSSSCIPQGQPGVRTRHRSCSNPAPSSNPPGKRCEGEDRQRQDCSNIPHCPVDGAWGSWSPLSSCSVTCGVGLQVSTRRCDSPAPKYGGRQCPGEGRRTSICKTDIHCPADGTWSQWTPWTPCQHPFNRKTDIRCKQLGGSQIRDRKCLHQAFNGTICDGSLTDRRVCYDVNRCYLKGTWNGWEPWSLCKPACGGNSRRFRNRRCDPDYSKYSPTIGRTREPATFFGTPTADCGPTPDGGQKIEIESCLNVPPCP